MANSNSDTPINNSVSNGENERISGPYYCHTCDQSIPECTTEFTCPLCSGGFIEPISDLSNDNSQENMDVSEDDNNNFSISIIRSSNSNPSSTAIPNNNRPIRRGVRRTRIAIHRIPTGQDQNPQDLIQGFLQQFVNGLMGGNAQNMPNPFNVQFPPMAFNPEDVVWTRGGLDNIITMFMNQMDNSGPPPAPKDEIDALPDVPINQSQIDKNTQCHVCMEDFLLEERVKMLPCKHLYHKDCIVPWLQLHGTCPICRKRIDNLDPQQPQQQRATSTTATTSSSSATTATTTMATARNSSDNGIANNSAPTNTTNTTTTSNAERSRYNDNINLD